MTNPGNAVGTNGAYRGRTSVNAFNDVLSAFMGRGILQGWECVPTGGMNLEIGGKALVRDVAIVENDLGQKTTTNNISNSPIPITLETAPELGSRIDVVVTYVNNPPDVPVPQPGENIAVDNPSVCGLIVVSSNVSATPEVPDETMIREAITADGAAGTTAYYAVIATINVATGASVITPSDITPGPGAVLGSPSLADNSVTTPKIKDGAVTSDKIDWTTLYWRNITTSLPNVNEIDKNGVWGVAPNSGGAMPTGSNLELWHLSLTMFVNTLSGIQLLFEVGANVAWIRQKRNGIWGGWSKFIG